MVSEVPLVSANLATVCIESFLYGIFFILFIFSTYLLLSRHKVSNPTKSIFLTPFFSASLLIFFTITAHWILTFMRLFDAFVNVDAGKNPLGFYANLKEVTEVVKTGFLMASLGIVDAMIIYRLWVVWNYNYLVIIFPMCTLVGLTVCGIGITYQFSVFPFGENVFTSVAGRWITSDCVFTLCTNIYSSSFIAYRIWKVNSAQKRRFGGQNLNSVLSIIVESAAIYTSWTIFFFASYEAQSNLQFVAVDAWPAMSGIAFMFIITRVGLGWAQKANSQETKTPISRIDAQHSRGVISSDSYAMRPLAVNITKVVDRNDDDNKTDRSFSYGSGKPEGLPV